MRTRHHLGFVALALALAFGTSGCSWFHRRKPQPVPQAQAPAPAPTTTTTATNTPPAEPEPMPAKPATEPPPAKPKPKPRTVTHPKKPATTAATAATTPASKPVEQASATPPPRIVIQEGGVNSAPSTQVTAAMPHDQNTDNQRTTQQLLDATDANLRGLRRTLSADERGIVEQIRSYMQQARDANKDGDLIRAHNLALKAHLLSDELAKR
jgi:outer membrane biosynthesis protein TonB